MFQNFSESEQKPEDYVPIRSKSLEAVRECLCHLTVGRT